MRKGVVALKLGLRELVMAGVFVALTTVLGYLVIPLPFSPVPITGQTFAVMLAGSLLGWRAGLVSMGLFVFLGLVGIPVFAGGAAGPGILLGPRGGYILSFPLAALMIGLLVQYSRRQGWGTFFVAHLAGGIILVYSLGVTQLALVTGMTWKAAAIAGAIPFILGDVLKAAVAAEVARRIHLIFPLWRSDRVN